MSVTPDDFKFVQAFIREEAGIVLQDSHDYLVDSRLAALLDPFAFKDLAALIQELRRGVNRELKEQVINALTTNESLFFRDLHPFEVLKSLLPNLFATHADRKIRFWSAACSTGQEPYSLAMMIHDTFPQYFPDRVEIVATDLSTEVLAKAQSGVFSQIEVNRGLPIQLLVKYFEKDGNQWKIKSDLQKVIQFSQRNLLDSFGNLGMMDVILMRNVLIYFDPETKADLIAKAAKITHGGGALFLGGADMVQNLNEFYDRMQPQEHKTIYYQRKAQS